MGYRMHAEWEMHEATWLSWPHNATTWEGHLEGAEAAFVRIIEELTPHEIVHLLVPNDAVKTRAMKKLKSSTMNADHLQIHLAESGDIWIRDYGPIFVTRKKPTQEVAFTKWIYNALGNKYQDLLIGDAVIDQLGLQQTRFDPNMVLEGGSIDVNGQGTLLTTESCLLNPNRNPMLRKEQIEQKLKDYLGVTNILWLHSGIEGDDTDGHVDDITRFVGPSTVVTVAEQDPKDANYQPLKENADRLKTMKDERGTPLTVLELPMPKVFVVEGRRMAASYANFYIANGVVLVPTYHQPSDAVALEVLQKCFPDRKVVGIDCRELIWGYGSIHCATQQQPA